MEDDTSKDSLNGGKFKGGSNSQNNNLNGEQDNKSININLNINKRISGEGDNDYLGGDIKRPDEKGKKVHYAWLKVLGIVGLVVITAAAVGAGVGLALGAFGISMGVPLVGSALVTAGGWLATAIPGLGAFGVALPIAIGAIAGLGIAFLAISGIRKLIKSFGNEQSKGTIPGGSGAGINEFYKRSEFIKEEEKLIKGGKDETEPNENQEKKKEIKTKNKEKEKIGENNSLNHSFILIKNNLYNLDNDAYSDDDLGSEGGTAKAIRLSGKLENRFNDGEMLSENEINFDKKIIKIIVEKNKGEKKENNDQSKEEEEKLEKSQEQPKEKEIEIKEVIIINKEEPKKEEIKEIKEEKKEEKPEEKKEEKPKEEVNPEEEKKIK